MTSQYKHLSSEERSMIQIKHSEGVSPSQIAQFLGRNRSTITREIHRRTTPNHPVYNATLAQQLYQEKRTHCGRSKKLIEGEPLYNQVHHLLTNRNWSPEQISERLKLTYPNDSSHSVSHETIYSTIYAHPKGELKKSLISSLRQAKSKRGNRRRVASGGNLKIEEKQEITNRPQEIETRQTPGHWEGDLIVGAYNRSCVGTLIERQTGWVILCKMADKSAEQVRLGFQKQLKKIDPFMRLSMTYDRGSEMAEHALMSKKLNMEIYFADPHSPWQRGSNENINGLIRQYLPKGIDLSVYTQSELNDIAWLLNTRPRKRLNWETPQEKFEKIINDYMCCT